ncbi:hypothetical protein B484DRAFT_338029 [Ochromonadaceae sp. CCMP2298]|nr:hypothetical protein B484DRAFT_338029 [Ochromonadaceae sp. CCMP2298]
MYLAGKTAIVTGGNSGIGLETCKALALAGCRVIMCSRDEDAAEAAIKLEVQQPGLGGYAVDGGNIAVRKLDLSSLGSIKAFAEVFKATEERLDFLILNAGIMALPKREETEHGWEKQIAVNHFGHFYLTQLLQEKMAASPYTAGRIVVLASSAHQFGQVKTEDLHYTKGRRYRSWEAYGQSKLANLLFAKGLADHLKDSGDANTRKLTAVAVHPGVIKTNLWR